ncbi:LysR substrate-binding domain-containing protein [Photobacterium galatheae]|uniref:LysR substrate-binding domain-containing protein n=1 Tax=Photobacterium galatheae TaxID=1654360 RepID=UPI00068B5B1D|nr:LysR substrate-binding domain-containing protein [Photobacterium galatheae]MCM0148315.1 LysR family transcriptional regulator [Photobacterium galatheae]
MKRQNLPLQGLLYFYKSASLGSFKSAAQELFVSPAAVSQQIRQLEASLDTCLFHRNHRQIELTPSGENLYREVKLGFSHLQAGVDGLTDDKHPNKLAISAPSSFAHHWLIPRLQGFREQFPEISILIEPSNRLALPSDQSIDLCVRFGQGQYQGMYSEWLMKDIIYPVCHPYYQEQHGIYSIDDLHKGALIEDVWTDMSWDDWFKHNGRKSIKPSLLFDGSLFVVESALAMQGIGLIKHSLAHRYIHHGTLVRIGEQAIEAESSYFICLPEKNLKRPKVKCFIQWLKEQVNDYSTS